jgi:hypothetical protein
MDTVVNGLRPHPSSDAGRAKDDNDARHAGTAERRDALRAARYCARARTRRTLGQVGAW